MKKISDLILLTFLLISTACTSVSMMTTGNRFDTPEVIGKTKIHINPVAIEGGYSVELTKDYVKTPPNTDNPRINYSPIYRLEAGASLGSHFEIELQLHANTPAMFVFKYQFLGEPKVSAKQGNFSAALTAGGGISTPVDVKTNFSSSNSYDNNINYYAIDAALLVGYRALDGLVIYAGPYYKPYFFDGNISQYSGSDRNTRTLISEVTFNGRLTTYGASLGVQVMPTEKLHIKVEAAYTLIKAGPVRKSALSPGFQFGLNF